jgi:hypothetical protein
MGVDFPWISTAISRGTSRNGFGTIVSFPSGIPSGNPPYGTIIGSGSEGNQLYWEYAGGTPNGYFVYATVPYLIKADGNGGSFLEYGASTETATFNEVIDDSTLGTSGMTRIIYKGDGLYSECQIYEPIGGTQNGGTLYIDIEYESGYFYYSITAGYWYSQDFSDGFCGTTTVTDNDWFDYGIEIYNSGGVYYYSDGIGGYYSETP